MMATFLRAHCVKFLGLLVGLPVLNDLAINRTISFLEDVPDTMTALAKSESQDTKAKKRTRKATKSILDDSHTYDMNHKNRGQAVIINNKRFSFDNLQYRKGSKKDVAAMQERLEELGFDITIKENLTADEIESVFKEVSLQDHRDNDCFLCILMTHGREGTVCGTDRCIPVNPLFKYFGGENCPSLIGKPKIFIIQACRGFMIDDGVDEAVPDSTPEKRNKDKKVKEIKSGFVSPEADFLICYSTVEGYVAWVDRKKGSWFIQSLSEAMKENLLLENKLDFVKLMTRVNRKVAEGYVSKNTLETHNGKKQMPCYTSMLRKDIYFTPKKKRKHIKTVVKCEY